jgi:hypothetical protein
VLLAYVDESFDDVRYDLGAILITPSAAKALEIALDDLACSVVAAHPGLVGPMEFHGHDIFQAVGAWRQMKSHVRARVGIYRRIVEFVVAHVDAILVKSVGSSRLQAGCAKSFARSGVAWSFLLQDINTHAENGNHLALVIADQVPDDEERRREFATYKAEGTFENYRKTSMPFIVDTVYFGPSRHSRLIQSIDCVLYILHREWTVTTGDSRQLAEVSALCEAIRGSGRLSTSRKWP